MELGLKDKVVLVLGGAGGLGSAIATGMAAEGARLAAADNNADSLDRLKLALGPAEADHLMLPWELSDLTRIEPNIQAIESQLGAVDILINITGGPPPAAVVGQDPELWSAQFRAMVLSVIAITDRVLPSMRQRGWGRVITSTSSGVLEPIPHLGLSNSLRSSLVGWSKTLAREVGPDGVTANVVVPGRIATDRILYLDRAKAERENRTVEDVTKASAGSIPVGRYGYPHEYADTVVFLASDRAAYITGSVIRVDGGMLASI
jgi:3-oxoacyl-[acyl-carrier protein] reductase